MFDNKYPYTDFSQLNLDWFLLKFKELLEEQERVSGKVKDLDDTVKEFTDFVTNYFDKLDVQAEVNVKLNEMAADGTLSDLLAPLVSADIGAVVAAQISDTVAGQIDDTVADQIGAVVADQIDAAVAPEVPGAVTDWLNDNVDPVGSAVVVDNTLSIAGAAADAKVTGKKISDLLNITGDDFNFPFEGYIRSDAGHEGEITGTNFFYLTDYVYCGFGGDIYFNLYAANNYFCLALYTKEKIYIDNSGIDSADSQMVTGTVTLPDNAYYVRICSYKTQTENAYCYFSKKIVDRTNDNELNLRATDDKISGTIRYDAFTNEGYISNAGVIVSTPWSRYTDYIPVNPEISPTLDYRLIRIDNAFMIAFYDKDKNFLSGLEGTGTQLELETGTCTVPANACYFIATAWFTGVGDLRVQSIVSANLKITDVIDCINREIDTIGLIKYLYGDSLNRPFSFNGKTAIAFGDSITYGIANEGSGNISAGANSYINKFAAAVGLTLTNKAVSGSCITYASDETYNSVYTVVTNTTEAADVIIIAGGTNDYNTGKTVGQFGDSTAETCYGALKLICEYLQTNYPDAVVIFITPINVTKSFNGHPRDELNLFRNAIFEVATYYGYNVVNGIDMVPVTKLTGYDDTMINHNDGCHPTLRGHALYARNLCMKLC